MGSADPTGGDCGAGLAAAAVGAVGAGAAAPWPARWCARTRPIMEDTTSGAITAAGAVSSRTRPPMWRWTIDRSMPSEPTRAGIGAIELMACHGTSRRSVGPGPSSVRACSPGSRLSPVTAGAPGSAGPNVTPANLVASPGGPDPSPDPLPDPTPPLVAIQAWYALRGEFVTKCEVSWPRGTRGQPRGSHPGKGAVTAGRFRAGLGRTLDWSR